MDPALLSKDGRRRKQKPKGINLETADEEVREVVDHEIQMKSDKFMQMHMMQQAEQAAQPEKLEVGNRDFQSRVEFVIDNNGQVDINVMWPHDTEETSKNLGLLFHAINAGDLEKNCANLLVKILQTYPEKKEFIKNAMETWRKKRDEEPLIEPSEVFGFNSQGAMDGERQ